MIFALFIYGMIGFAILLVLAAVIGAIVGVFKVFTGIDLCERFPLLLGWLEG